MPRTQAFAGALSATNISDLVDPRLFPFAATMTPSNSARLVAMPSCRRKIAYLHIDAYTHPRGSRATRRRRLWSTLLLRIIHAQRLQGKRKILECSIAPQLHKRSKPSAPSHKENLQDSVFFSFVHVWCSTALVGRFAIVNGLLRWCMIT